MNTSELNHNEPTAAHPSGHPARDMACTDHVSSSPLPSQQNLSASEFAAVRYPCFIMATLETGPIDVYCLNTEDDAIRYGCRLLNYPDAYLLEPIETLEFLRQMGAPIPDDVIQEATVWGYAVRMTEELIWLPPSRAPSPLTWLYECLQSRLNATRVLITNNFEEACAFSKDSGMTLQTNNNPLTQAILNTVAQNYRYNYSFSLPDFLNHLAIPTNISNSDSITLLHLTAVYNDAIGAQHLIRNSVVIDLPDRDDMTPLMYAARNNDNSVMTILLEAGANPSYYTRAGVYAIHIAAQHGHDGIIKILCRHDVNPNTIDVKGATALLYAARQGHLACIEVLLAAGADLTVKDKQGNTALSIAHEHNHKSVVAALEAKQLTAQRARPPEHGGGASLGL